MITFVYFVLILLLLLVIIVYKYKCFDLRRGCERWSVGISRVEDLKSINIKTVKTLSYKFVKEVSGMDFIADPFLIKKDERYYLFVEAAIEGFGRIDVYSSTDLSNWKHEGVAMSKEHHLSYPQVFEYGDKIYMIPETKKAGEVALYVSVEFPLKWAKKSPFLD